MAKKKSEPVTVQIQKKTLFIGDAAYPIRGLVGVVPVTLVVRKWVVFRKFLISMLLPIAVLYAGSAQGMFEPAAGLAAILTLVYVIVLLVRLSRPPLHVVSVQNAAGSRLLVTSEQHSVVTGLIGAIVDAVDEPSVTYGPIQLTTINAGRDYISSAGSDNKITTGASR